MTVETRPAEVVSAPKVKTTADVLRHAALIIEERGWNQGGYRDESGALCLLGSINTAVSGTHMSFGDGSLRAGIQMVKWLGASALDYNDAPGRTAADVTAALRAAADASERAS